MKRSLLSMVTLLLATGIYGQNYNFLGDYTSDGTPLYFDGKDDVSQATLDLIANALPEGYPVPDYNPHYITSGYDTDIVLEEDAEVWVTFVGEGAGYKNVLGFYTYSIDQPMVQAPAPEDITIIFPNVSALNSGGSLEVGHRVKIGQFAAGTGIGWVLLANGWKGYVSPGNWQLYSNTDFNPEANEQLRHHNVLLSDPDNERIILGFEDIRRDYSSCDNDFNDALFYITANPFTSVKTTNYNKISDYTPVSSGNDCGLESNGDLARLIAKRNFDRQKQNSFRNKQALQSKYSKSTVKAMASKSGDLGLYFPESGMFGNETPYISSPEDLLEITNADQIFGVDYYQGTDRVSAALAIHTSGSVYNHSKTICDRLNGSQLLDLRTVTLKGHQLVYSQLKREDGSQEYALLFSVREENASRTVYSFWNLDQYPEGDYMNFQIWGSSMGQVSAMASHVLDRLNKEKKLASNKAEQPLPQVFIKNGFYQNGKLYLNIVNKSNARWLLLDGNYKVTEQQDLQNLNTYIDLNGEWEQQIAVDSGHIFDMGLSIMAENSFQHDAIYLADGPWGIDMNPQIDTVQTFDIQAHAPWQVAGHTIERGIMVLGKVKETINVFRNLMPGDMTLNVAPYRYLQFKIKSSVPVEVSLVTNATDQWSNRLRLSLEASPEEKQYVLPFSQFTNKAGASMDFDELRSIVVSVQGDYAQYNEFEVSLDQMALTASPETTVLAFGQDTVTETAMGPANEIWEGDPSVVSLKSYPNPFAASFHIALPEPATNASIRIVDLVGHTVMEESQATRGDLNVLEMDLGHLPKGMYVYLVYNASNGNYYKGKIIKD